MFTGKERDYETGLDFFGARYYGSAQGRFTSPDPITGTPLHIINPQRWNMYAYGLNNPLFYTDPDGRDAIAVGLSQQVRLLGVPVGHAGGTWGQSACFRTFQSEKLPAIGTVLLCHEWHVRLYQGRLTT